jgi:anti-anti-sigma factor
MLFFAARVFRSYRRRVMLDTASGYELDVERGPDSLLVRVVQVDASIADTCELAEQVWGLLKQHFTYRLVLELDEVGMLTAHLVGQLAELYERIERHDGLMRLCGLSPENRDVLHACGLEDRLVLYHDREEAVMGRCHPLPR